MTNVQAASIATTIWAMPWWNWVIIIVSLTIAICFVTWFIVKVVRGKIKFGSVEIGGRNISENGESPHAVCEHRFSIGTIIRKLIDWSLTEQDIRTRGILGAQMVKTEEYLLSMKDQGTTWFIAALRLKLKEIDDSTVAIHHADYLHFRLVTQEFIVRIKDMIRAACINNGFTTMDDMRYKEYVKDMQKRIGSYAERFYGENYIGSVIHTESLDSKGATELYQETAEIIFAMFDSLRRIAINKQAELASMLIKKQDFIAGKLGLKDL